MYRNFYRLFILTISFLWVSQALAQDAIHNVLTTRDGLPSDQVYVVHQDRKGNMWFCTDNGIARFDGLQMKVYRLEQGLPDNVVFMMREDPRGRLWFSTYSGGVFYVENDTVVIPSFNEDLTEKLSSYFLQYLHIDEHDSIFMVNYHYEHGIFKAHISDTTVTEMPIKDFVSPDTIAKAKDFRQAFMNTSIALGALQQKEFVTFEELGLINKHNSFLNASAIMKSGTVRKMHIEADGTVDWVVNVNQLTRITDKGLKLIRNFPSHIHYINRFDDELLVTTVHSGMYRFSILDSVEGTLKFLSHHNWDQLAGITRDNSGAYWMCTLFDGLIYMPSPKDLHLKVPEPVKMTTMDFPAHFANDTIYSIRLLENRRKVNPKSWNLDSQLEFLAQQPHYTMSELKDKPELQNSKDMEHFYTMYRDSSKIELIDHQTTYRFLGYNVSWVENFIYSGNYRIRYKNPGDLTYELLKPAFEFYLRNRFLWVQKTFHPRPGHFLFTLNRGFLEFTMDSLIFDGIANGISEPVTTVLRMGDLHYLYGTLDGLFEYTGNGPPQLYSKNPLLNFRIQTLNRDRLGRIYVGTRGGGLAIISQDSIFGITELEGLSDNYIRVSRMHNDTLWLATDNGLSMVYLNENLEFDVDCHWLNDLSGYNPINNLAINKNEIAIYKDDAFYFVKRSYKGKVQPPRILIEEALLSGRSQGPAEEGKVYSVSGRNNNLEFNFRINGLLSDPFVRYQYRLKGYEDEWTTTKERQVSYQNIPYGSYSFEVRAINAHNMQSANTASFGVDILKPIFMQLWFQILIGLSFIGLSLLIVNIYFKRKNKRLLQEKAMISSNIFALKMQINPHFIFNALNSIQYFIASNQGRPANEFLTKFSKLIRDILTKANQTKVTLEEELKSLRNYIELEETRTKGTLQWSLEVEEGIDQRRIFIPSMVIQPIVENAIWHGLSKADMDPTMLIRIYKDGNTLKCEVQDNGPGIPLDRVGKGESGARQLHRSVGLSNVIQRLELISKMEGKSYTIDFGHVHPEKEYKGTRVVIGVPVG